MWRGASDLGQHHQPAQNGTQTEVVTDNPKESMHILGAHGSWPGNDGINLRG